MDDFEIGYLKRQIEIQKEQLKNNKKYLCSLERQVNRIKKLIEVNNENISELLKKLEDLI